MPQLPEILPTKSAPGGAQRLCHIACCRTAAYRRCVPTRSAKVLVLAGLCLAVPLFSGCAAGGSPNANSVGSANQRLGGAWRLQSFAPLVSLDLPLQAVLGAEVGTLVVTFSQGQFSAVGPGVNFNGRYEVTSASGEQLSLVLYDPQNVAYHFSAQFAGNLLHFQSNDKPWVGFGALEHT